MRGPDSVNEQQCGPARKTGRIAARPEVMSHGITNTIAADKYIEFLTMLDALSRAWLSVKIPLPHAGQAR
jgi:hypothetical protein